MKQILYLVFAAVSLVFSCSAETEGGVDVRILSTESRFVDSITGYEAPLLRARLDSVCAADFETAVARATDSIVQERLEDEARLRARRPIDQMNPR